MRHTFSSVVIPIIGYGERKRETSRAVRPLLAGGGQERGRRSGTENVAGAVGMAAALSAAAARMDEEAARLTALRDRLLENILKIPKSALTGSRTNRLPGLASVTVEGIEGESMVLLLDLQGIAASTGSACSTGSLDPSHVLMALGLKHETAHGSLRLSLGRYSDEADVEKISAVLPDIVARLRAMSPVWNGRKPKQRFAGADSMDIPQRRRPLGSERGTSYVFR